MGIDNIIQRAMLISKTTGQKQGILTKDVVRFINKKGEPSIFTVFKDGSQRPVKKVLLNKKTGAINERTYSYQNYTYENGETVPYKVVMTKILQSPHAPLNNCSSKIQEREVIAVVQNGEKLDVTKSRASFFQPGINSNISERSSIARFSNGKKPVGVVSDIERTPKRDIISKDTRVQLDNGRVAKIVPDLFYNTAVYDDIMFKNEIIAALKSEMGLKDYGIIVKPAHRGYTQGGRNNLAKYNHKKKEVSLSVDVPWVRTRKGFTSEVSHEFLHAWQRKEVELLEKGLLSGARKEAAQKYKKEFSNYISSDTELAAYEKQTVETKAREFQKFIEKYYNQNLKNIYNKYVQGIIPPQIGITTPLPQGQVKVFV